MEKKKQPTRLADLCNKAVLTTEELAVYTGWSKSYIFKLTSTHKLPFSKPLGKKIYFDRAVIDAFLLGAPVQTQAEVEAEAQKIGRAL